MRTTADSQQSTLNSQLPQFPTLSPQPSTLNFLIVPLVLSTPAGVVESLPTCKTTVPVAKHDHSVAVALADPSDLDVVDTLQRLLSADIELRVATEEDIEAALAKGPRRGPKPETDEESVVEEEAA